MQKLTKSIHYEKNNTLFITIPFDSISESYLCPKLPFLPYPYSDINYYRLKMINADGSFQYSKTESVKMMQQKAFNVYPNPLSKNQKLVIESTHNEPFEVTIFDVNGKQVLTKN